MDTLDSGVMPTNNTPVGQGTRFGNLFLDGIALSIISWPIRFIPYMAASQEQMKQAAHDAAANQDLSLLFDSVKDYLFISMAIGIIVNLIYYILMEHFNEGRTIGKMITKTKVVNADGSKPTIGTIVIRSLCRFIPFDKVSFLFGPVGWHDRISKTRVVTDKPIVGVGY